MIITMFEYLCTFTCLSQIDSYARWIHNVIDGNERWYIERGRIKNWTLQRRQSIFQGKAGRCIQVCFINVCGSTGCCVITLSLFVSDIAFTDNVNSSFSAHDFAITAHFSDCAPNLMFDVECALVFRGNCHFCLWDHSFQIDYMFERARCWMRSICLAPAPIHAFGTTTCQLDCAPSSPYRRCY